MILTFKFPDTITSASFMVRRYYLSLLYHFEQVYYFRKQVPPSSTLGKKRWLSYDYLFSLSNYVAMILLIFYQPMISYIQILGIGALPIAPRPIGKVLLLMIYLFRVSQWIIRSDYCFDLPVHLMFTCSLNAVSLASYNNSRSNKYNLC